MSDTVDETVQIAPESKILIIGRGFIGQQLMNFLAADNSIEVHSISQAEVNYMDNAALLNFFIDYAENQDTIFDTVINCSGVTGEKNVDDVESNKELAYLYNTVLPSSIAAACATVGIPHFINVSSGCIFDGYKKDDDGNEIGWDENDVPNFGMFNDESSWYSKTKHAGELGLTSSFSSTPRVYNLRIRMPIGETTHPRNTLLKLAQYTNLLDTPNSVTYLYDLFNFVYNLIIANEPYNEASLPGGIINIVSDGAFDVKTFVNVLDIHKDELKKLELIPEDWSKDKITFLNKEEFVEKSVTKVGRSSCLMDNTLAKSYELHTFAEVNGDFLDKIVQSMIKEKDALVNGVPEEDEEEDNDNIVEMPQG